MERNYNIDMFGPHAYSNGIYFNDNFALNHWQGREKEEDIIKGRTLFYLG